MSDRKRANIIVVCFLMLFITVSLFSKTVEIISFNDSHGRIHEDTSLKGKDVGMTKFAAVVKDKVKNCNGDAIVVSAGDNYQGSAITVLTKGTPVSDMMREINVSASAVGNHEFDWGIGYFKKWQKDGGFPFLAANIINKKTNKIPEWARPYLIVERAGVKIAFIGLTTMETPFLTHKENIKNLKFINPAKAAQQWIDFLNSGKDKAGKPDIIVALTHIASYQDKLGAKITGKEINELCNKTKGLNAVISGHDHKVVCGYINDIPVIQAYCNCRALGVLKVVLDNDNKLKKVIPSIMEIYKNKDKLQKDVAMTRIYNKYLSQMEKLNKPIGRAVGDFLKNEEGDNISDIGAWVTKAMVNKTSSQIAVINSGGIRVGLNSGDITISDMYALIPFENAIVTMNLSGKALKRVIEYCLEGPGEFYGVKVHYDNSAPKGSRIVSMALLNGGPIEMGKDYRVATLDFIVNGGDKFDFSDAKDIKKTQEILRDFLIEKVKENKTIRAVKADYLVNIASQQDAA